uniref:Uncharacterized protein n=1 Tax=Triticum urartu TaxID=4572 RepID=A0A8R7P0I8_TRIUA
GSASRAPGFARCSLTSPSPSSYNCSSRRRPAKASPMGAAGARVDTTTSRPSGLRHAPGRWHFPAPQQLHNNTRQGIRD